ncbi:MAG: PEP-CTERM sorting domain-containing protein [Planctomycetes bacterium]|nr:PEP-CTERM sorting domain-containing protein [Planctomycetota bacterium]
MSHSGTRRFVSFVAALGIGLFVASPAWATLVADSQPEFSGVQGQNNWQYGYYNRTGDTGEPKPAFDDTYQADDFTPFPTSGAYPRFGWRPSVWDYLSGPGAWVNPPWTTLDALGGHPNGTNHPGPAPANEEHWTIRRWIAESTGSFEVTVDPYKSSGAWGTINARVYRNGSLQFLEVVTGSKQSSGPTTFHIAGVQAGDAIDFVIDPAGDDGSDSTRFLVTVDDKLTQLPKGTQVADSASEFSGVQGNYNWFHGYHNATANGAYDATPGGTDDFISFPDDDGPGTSPTDFWTGSAWDWDSGNPPWTFLGATDAHPNTGGDDHWVLRRWVSETFGLVDVEWFLRKTNTNGGDGVTGRLFLNGVEMDVASILGTDGVGVTRTALFSVRPGDFIDLALDPNATDGNDGSAYGMTITTNIPEPGTLALLAFGGIGALVRRRRRRK